MAIRPDQMNENFSCMAMTQQQPKSLYFRFWAITYFSHSRKLKLCEICWTKIWRNGKIRRNSICAKLFATALITCVNVWHGNGCRTYFCGSRLYGPVVSIKKCSDFSSWVFYYLFNASLVTLFDANGWRRFFWI